MEAQILSDGINAAGIPVVSALTDESVTVGEMVLRKNGLKHALLGSWIRVEPWNELLCRSLAVDHGKDQESGAVNGDFGRENEALQDRRLAEIALGHHDQVAQDVRRTRSEIALFRDDQARNWLQRCVILFCQERGLQYVQGLSELAAPWAFITDPPSFNGFGFRCFSSFLDQFAPYMFSTAPDAMYEGVPKERGSTSPLVVLETLLAMFDQLLRYHDPDLASFMESCGLTPDAYATSWFVTIFARQTPIPVLLHMWERLVRSGDPLFHQFLALAWLLRNRRVLLGTRHDDVPEVLSRLRLQSTEDVDGMWVGAMALRSATPNLVCNMLRVGCYDKCTEEKRSSILRELKVCVIRVCYQEITPTWVLNIMPCNNSRRFLGECEGDLVSAEGTERESPDMFGRLVGRLVTFLARHDPRRALRKVLLFACSHTRRRIIRRLAHSSQATGIVVADADQVAELAISVSSDDRAQVPRVHDANFVSKQETAVSAAAGIKDGRFVLVDCRSGNTVRGPARSGAGVNVMQASRHSRETPSSPSLCNGRFVWHTIDPMAFLGRESEAASELLRGVAMAGMPVEGTTRSGHMNGRRVDSEIGVSNGVGNRISNGYMAKAHGVIDPNAEEVGCLQYSLFTAPTTTPGLPVTHVCFVGCGQGSGSGEKTQLAADPAVRLARGVARSGLARVCVLEGGFVSLEEALGRRASAAAMSVPWSSDSTPCATPVLEVSSAAVADEVKPAYIEARKLVNDGRVTSAAIAAPANGSGEVLSLSQMPSQTVAGDGVMLSKWPMLITKQSTTVIGSSKPAVPVTPSPTGVTQPQSDGSAQTAQSVAVNSNSKSSQGHNDPASPNLATPPTEAPHVERRVSSSVPRPPTLSTPTASMSERRPYRMPSSRKISEPFKIYATKSAEDMGRALRTVPIYAGKPLEDAARVCDALAKTNVKVLGESRVSLTRSLTRLEQLDARMSGTVGAFTRHFRGRNRRVGDGVRVGAS